jgi:ABC-type antimicrobial peptide transport system permease subunit
MAARFLAVRTNANPLTIVRELRQIAGDLDRDEPLNHVMLLTDIVERETGQSKTQSTLLSVLAALALIMACVGIYGAMAYLVSQRTQEIGVRMALGAQKKQILGLVLKGGLTLTLIGMIAGVFAAVILMRLMSGLLFGVSPTDIGVMTGVTILLTLTAAFACLVPARRAVSIDPIEALRAE